MPRLHWILMLSAAGLIGCEAPAPVAETPAEETEVVETLVVEMPTETPVAEETPMVKTAKPEMPAEVPAAEEAPKIEAPKAEMPAEKPAAEAAPKVETPAEAPATEAAPKADAPKAEMPAEAPAAEAPAKTPAASEATAGAALDGDVKLNAKNTLVQFVGTHSGDKPDPRTGKFGELSGTATFAEGMPREINVEIKTESLSTEIEKLTGHLKSPDFFNVREFPVATFKTTGIESTEPGKFAITGDLTLLGETKSITFPATVEAGKLTADFKIDRTEFGMTYGDGKVEKEVAMTIEVTAK
ncbi:YceI family protein [Blastopirellula sp. J2-11]|uniref:YceI family protein n=1 Tax=Blastopirellula sp. J2-11 TaxID=2943192 RepID=UPI0021C6472B|nr:YceI family protein [Blastopirellula sp. J2-11]UUO06804.1 YceI family protein [Blastopirellula sp. J2-11]